MVTQHVVDNRVFLLGLDRLYREAMKRHERTELLICARRVAARLRVSPANAPVEGYYAEEAELTDYFRIMRALQEVEGSRAYEVARMKEFERLRNVTSAPVYGHPVIAGKLLPAGRDALFQALSDTYPEWTVARLTSAAYQIAQKTDDISLVGLAARIRDPVVLAAVRESVVLYAEAFAGGQPAPPEFVWAVENELANLASRFIDAFNTLFGEELPRAEPALAARYWEAYEDNEILGRCVRIAYDDSVQPIKHYHWGIYRNASGEFAVQEFWQSKVWPTWAYRRALGPGGRSPQFSKESSGNQFIQSVF